MTEPSSSAASAPAASSAAPRSSPGRKLFTARRVNPYFLNWLSSHSLREARRRAVRTRDMGARLAHLGVIVQWASYRNEPEQPETQRAQRHPQRLPQRTATASAFPKALQLQFSVAVSVDVSVPSVFQAVSARCGKITAPEPQQPPPGARPRWPESRLSQRPRRAALSEEAPRETARTTRRA